MVPMVPASRAQQVETRMVPLKAFQIVSLCRMPFCPYIPFSVMFSSVTHHLVVRLSGSPVYRKE